MATYSPILTNAGAAKIAAARVSGNEITYTHLAVGDANGVSYAPAATQTVLVHEVWRGEVESVYVHANYPNQVVCEARIPITAGGFDIREAGVFLADGTMVAVSRYPTTTKPLPGSGSEKDLLVRFIFEVANAAEVTHVIDPSLIYATKEYVDARLHHVRLATTGNITLSGTQTIDGVSAVVGDRVLVQAQTDGKTNGIYVVKTGSWTRALDFNTPENIIPMALVCVSEGTTYKDNVFKLTNDSIVLGTTSLVFAPLTYPFETTAANIKMDGTQSTGSSNTVARGDHVHPTDTSRLAAAVYTAADVLQKLLTVDGSGSGVDADFFRSLPLDRFIYGTSARGTTVTTDANAILKTGTYMLASSGTGLPTVSDYLIEHYQWSTSDLYAYQIAMDANNTSNIYIRRKHNTWGAWSKLWTADNDGSGSGLDADTCKGYGIGSYGGYYTVTDLNNYPVGSVGLVTPATNTLTNSPISTSYKAIVTTLGYNDYVEQTLQNSVGMGDIWVRRKYNTSWGSWYKLAFTESPTFTGEPLAPTPAVSDNSTKVATTAFVKAAITALVNSSPAALDTLNELAAALGNDPNFATTMTNALASKQPLDATLTALAAVSTAADKLIYATGLDAFSTTTLTAFIRTLLDDTTAAAARTTLGAAALDSPGFTGVPTAPTAAVGTNTTQIATTAFAVGSWTPNHVVLPNGTIIQWGKIDIISNPSTQTAIFPVAFPTECYNVTASFLLPSTSSASERYVHSFNNTSVTFTTFSTSGSIMYMAIGR